MINRKTTDLLFCVTIFFNQLSIAAAQDIPAFPGADGAAAFVTGGRGGIVYHVTKLDRNFSDRSRGTLRYGLDDANFPDDVPRTIVFDIAGTFWLGRYGAERGHDNGWDSQSRLNLGSNVTVAGQTAPGPVVIMGGVVKAGGSNSVLRNVTIAPGYGMRGFEKPDERPPILPSPGDFPDNYTFDAIDVSGQGIMIDHVTAVYATDETISIRGEADDVTVQYSNISQAQNYPQADAEGGGRFTGHGLGSLIQPNSGANVSVHNNLYAHMKGRLPRVGTERSDLTDPNLGSFNDFRNNLFYNWLGTAGQGASGQPSQNNFVNNMYLAGPGGEDAIGGSDPGIVNRDGGTAVFTQTSGTQLFTSGNLRDTNKNGQIDDLRDARFGRSIEDQPFRETPFFGHTVSATAAFERVINFAGSNWSNRSFVDTRIMEEVRTGTGAIVAWADDPFDDDPTEGVEWRSLLAMRAGGDVSFQRPASWDTDGDGIPNYWEIEHDLPTDITNNNGDFDDDGYTDLEEYLNDAAAWPAPKPIEFTGAENTRFARIENWDLLWQPSRHDRALIGAGLTAVVDAVGQRAGDIQIKGGAVLEINSGWLKVQDDVASHSQGVISIGDESSNEPARLNLLGGELFVQRLESSENGLFEFTGGSLHADEIAFDLVVDGGTLAPGTPIGSTHVHGDLRFKGNSTLRIDLDGNLADLLIVDGQLDLGIGTSLDVVQSAAELTESRYLIATYADDLEGDFLAIADGFSIDTSIPGAIYLLVPEPTDGALLLAAISTVFGSVCVRRKL